MPQSKSRLVYICSCCGEFTVVPDWVDVLDSGTTLICDKCGGETVFDLDTSRERTTRYTVCRVLRELDQGVFEVAANACEDAGWPTNEKVAALRSLAAFAARVRKIQEIGDHSK